MLQGGASEVDVEIFASSWKHVTDAIMAVDRWSREVVRRIVQERWPDPPKRIPLGKYLRRCVESEEEKMRRFREMIDFLRQGG
jgi:hypothetical protein